MGYWVVLYQKTLYIPVVLKQNLIYFYTWNGLLYKKMRVRVELLINSRTEYAGCNYISCVPYIMVVCEMVEKLPGSYSYNHLQDNLGCNTLDSLRMMLKFVKQNIVGGFSTDQSLNFCSCFLVQETNYSYREKSWC